MNSPTLQHELGKSRPFESPSEEAYLNLLRTTSLLAHQTEQLFKAHGLSEPTYNTLRILRGHRQAFIQAGDAKIREYPGVPCSIIARQLVTQVPDLTRLVDRLVRDGYAIRQRGEHDRRVVHIDITAKGLKVIENLQRPLDDLHETQLDHMSPRELKSLSRLLVKARCPHVAKDTK
ncbi:MAG: MarR family transcriptional regulator [Planctomycetota bacterium]|nr:MarR family transcriptional regulator [Planctomycetota bacterium]